MRKSEYSFSTMLLNTILSAILGICISVVFIGNDIKTLNALQVLQPNIYLYIHNDTIDISIKTLEFTNAELEALTDLSKSYKIVLNSY